MADRVTRYDNSYNKDDSASFEGYKGVRGYAHPTLGVMGPWVLPPGFYYTGVKSVISRERLGGQWIITSSPRCGPYHPVLIVPPDVDDVDDVDDSYRYLLARRAREHHYHGFCGISDEQSYLGIIAYVLGHELSQDGGPIGWLERELKRVTARIAA